MWCGAGILGGMQDPANIQAWHRAMELAVRVHRITRNIRRAEAPGLASQLRRAVGSIPANIAEGVGQPSAADCARFLSYAISSAFEVESHLVLADKLGLKLPGIGDAIEVSCSGENVYDTMVKVADIGSLDFTVNFNISTLGYSLFYADNLGANRTATVKFSQQNNTVGNLSRSTNIMNYASLYHAVGSKGKDKNPIRTIYPTTAPTGIALREAYVKGADQTTTNQLRYLSFARFRRQRFLIQSYDIEVLQSAAWRYGRDYYLGDLVSVVTNITTTITRKIFAVSLSMNSQGVEEVRIDLAAN